MSMLYNYKPEDITPSMRKYLGMPYEVAQDEGTSEGAKKGWETRRHGIGNHQYSIDPEHELVEESHPHDIDDIHEGVIDDFLTHCRNNKNDKWYAKKGDKTYYASSGRRKGEIKLQTDAPRQWGMYNTTRDVLSWRPKNIPRSKPKPSLKTLIGQITDPLEKGAAYYFGSLNSVNPTYATSPEDMAGYLRGYNGDREISDTRQIYGKTLGDYFQSVKDAPSYAEAIDKMKKIMDKFHSNTALKEAFASKYAHRRTPPSLDLRGGVNGY